MYFRTILSGTLALFLISGAAAHADERAGIFNGPKLSENSGESRFSVPSLGLQKLFGSKGDKGETVTVAQAGDPRITSLEEQIRSLSGTVEELNFQILQMQEQMRKMQEDNEFRFQELEGKRSDSGAPSSTRAASAPAADNAARADIPVEDGDVSAHMQTEIIIDSGTGDPGQTAAIGAPPQDFGTITFDDKGNVTGGTIGGEATHSAPAGSAHSTSDTPASAPHASTGEFQMAALPSTDNPDELYRNSYEFILSGDYSTAEAGFRDHISRFPSDQKAADAHFWLGEALLGQKKYSDAAEVFLASSKDYPSSRKAPDMLLKLGISLVGLDQPHVACETFAEVSRRYPDISGALKQRVKQEQALARC